MLFRVRLSLSQSRVLRFGDSHATNSIAPSRSSGAMDRGWDIAQGLNSEGTHEFESRATEYPVVWRTDSVLQRQDLRLQVTESDCVAT
jgi:hypothetical protein